MSNEKDNSILERSSVKKHVLEEYGICDACGGCAPFKYDNIINETLAKQWGLNSTQRKSMSARESMYCPFCGCSYRLRLLARAINYWVKGNSENCLLKNIQDGCLNNKKVAEVNSCGVLHEILKLVPGLKYSEYGSTNSLIPNEDIQSLSYSDSSFDIVLTSDVLEHIPDYKKALTETFRVLKPGGVHILTVPVLMDRISKQRAHISDNSIKYDQEASFHGSGGSDYLVWNEFGSDILKNIMLSGFDAYYVFNNTKNKDDISGVIIAIKSGSKVKMIPGKNDHLTFKIDCEWQSKRVAMIVNKLKLTNDHVDNITNLLDNTKIELDLIKNSRSWKLINKIKKLKPQ